MHAFGGVGQAGSVNAKTTMQTVQSVQATDTAGLNTRFLPWPSMLGIRGLAEESPFSSGVSGVLPSFDMSMPLSSPSKKARVKREVSQGSQHHSPDCLLMRYEQAQLATQSPENESNVHATSSSEARDASQQLERDNDTEDQRSCGCSERAHTGPCWEQGWHPRVDNSALGFAEDEGFEDLQDVVSFTAVSFAAYRAIETERPDALFQDPLAEYLAGEQVMKKQKVDAVESDYPGVRFAVRTKYFDDALMLAIRGLRVEKPDSKVQVVIFGCGMDARSWRLPASLEGSPPAEVVFEGDRPDVMARKERLIEACEEEGRMPPLKLGKRREVISVDFNTDTWKELILKKGFRTSEPTVWLFEGLIMYLTPEAVANLTETVAEMSAPGSILLTDGLSATAVARARVSPKASPVMRSWTWGANDPQSFFNAHGWNVQNVEDLTSGMYGRVLPHGPSRERNITWYMTARRD